MLISKINLTEDTGGPRLGFLRARSEVCPCRPVRQRVQTPCKEL